MSKESGVGILLGDQRKGIVALAIPLGIALFVQQINALVDSLWVAGLGANAIAAVGIVGPIYASMVGIGGGLGIGVSAAISRSIGRGDKERSDMLAVQGLILTAMISVVLTAVLLILAEPLLILFGAGDTLPMCIEYAVPLFIGTVFIILSGVLSGMLRGEGAAKRSMIIQTVGAIVNIVLDPILIYSAGWGISGAAWATVVAAAVSCLIPIWWYLIKKDTYVVLKRSDLKYDRDARNDILIVGLPEMLELSIMNIFNIILNIFVIMCGGTDAVAIFTAQWRVLLLCVVPAQAIGGALVSICSAEYGMKKFDRIKDAFHYGIKVSFLVTVVLSVVLIVLADPIASIYTMSDDMKYLHDELRLMIILGALFIPSFSFVYTGSSVLQALRKAGQAMINTTVRNILVAAAFALVAFTVKDTYWLWYALLITEIIGGLMMYGHARLILKDILRREGVSIKGL